MAEPATYLLQKMWQYSNKKHVVWYMFMFIIANALIFLEPLLIGGIFNSIQQNGLDDIPHILLLLGLFMLIRLSFWFFHGPARVLETQNAFFVRAKYKRFLLEGTMDLTPEWQANNHSGDTFDKIEKGSTALFDFSKDTFLIVETIMRLVGSYLALIYFNVHASYSVGVLIVITLGTILAFDKRLIPRYAQIYKMDNAISAKVFDAISNISTIIILRVERLVTSAIYKKILGPFALFRKTTVLNEIKWFIVAMSSSLMIITVILTYILTTSRSGEVVLLGTLYALYEYVTRITNIFFRFAYKYGDIVQQKTQVDNAEILAAQFTQKKSHVSILGAWNTLEIRNLSFSYNKDEMERHLDNISLTIHRGEKIALIGESGSGKTTFLKILRELYTARVAVYIDGKKIDGFHQISEDITLIPQDPEIFNTSIKENITIGTPHSLAHIKKYTNLARITHVVEKLPNAWDAQMQEKGVNLSGGQKQRLALARGLLAAEHKKIILLDESTSSVDPKNEQLIYDNILGLKEKTIIASIHKLHLLSKFDRIYQFSEGKITAQGTFAELLKLPEFKKQWDDYTKENS